MAVLGACGVGKTALIMRLFDRPFPHAYAPTIEDLYIKPINVGMEEGAVLEFLDATGSYDFPAMRRLAIETSHVFIIVHSVDAINTFEAEFSRFHQHNLKCRR